MVMISSLTEYNKKNILFFLSLLFLVSCGGEKKALPSVWVWSVLQCLSGRCATSATILKTTYASSKSLKLHSRGFREHNLKT